MNPELLTNQGFLYLVTVVSFLAFVLYDRATAKSDPRDEPITSNSGSRMVYALRQAGIVLGIGVVALLIGMGAFELFDDQTPDTYFLSTPALMVLSGALYARAALNRAKDAGLSRWGAMLALVPLANFYLLLAQPRESSSRPPYVPASGAARAVIALLALLSIPLARGIDTIGSEYLVEHQVSKRITRLVQKQQASLPVRLDDVTILTAIKASPESRTIIYSHTVTAEGSDTAAVKKWLTTSLKPESAKLLCADPIVTQHGWSVVYRYVDEASAILGEIKIGGLDCL